MSKGSGKQKKGTVTLTTRLSKNYPDAKYVERDNIPSNPKGSRMTNKGSGDGDKSKK